MIEKQSVVPETGLADQLQEFHPVPADAGKRFVNYLVDNVVLYLIVNKLTAIWALTVLDKIFPSLLEWAYEGGPGTNIRVYIVSYMIVIPHYLIYYTLSEKAFKGRTLGKFLTGTRAIRDDGQEITWKDAILRSLCRMIPFETLSGFAYRPWHDSLTKTTVISARA
jgi:uncharacterized RDD family membrane protein YckC